MTGRPRKPSALHRINGNPSHRPLNGSEPQPRPGIPPCPAWLDAYAQAEWAALAPELESLGLLTVIDGNTLSVICQAWAEFRISTETLQREGRTVRVPVLRGKQGGSQDADPPKVVGHKIVAHPAVAQQRSAWKAIKDFSTLFGLDPSSRSRIHVQPPEEDDPLKAFRGDAS